MRKLILLILVVFYAIVLTSCNSAPAIKEEDEMMLDMQGKEFYYRGDSITGGSIIKINSATWMPEFNVTDRKTDSKNGTDTVIAHTRIDSEKAYIEGDIKLEYKLYDQGWKLESLSRASDEIPLIYKEFNEETLKKGMIGKVILINDNRPYAEDSYWKIGEKEITEFKILNREKDSSGFGELIQVEMKLDNISNPKWEITKIEGKFDIICQLEELGYKGWIVKQIKQGDYFSFSIPSSNQNNEGGLQEVNISKEEKEKLDIFFSNFSEVFLQKFRENSISDEELIRFSIYHNLINNRQAFKGDSSIEERYVNYSIYKYFGIKLNASKTAKDKFGYENGKYFLSDDVAGEIQFSQIDKMFSLGNDEYLCYVSTYTASSGFTGSIHTPIELSNSDMDLDNDVIAGEKLVAKIKKITGEDNSRYILLSYELR